MRSRLITLLMLMTMAMPTFAFDLPKDAGTLEALISLHKLIKGA